MKPSADDPTSLFEQYYFHFGVGAVAVITLGIMTFQFTVSADDGEHVDEQGLAPPPMPTTGVEAVENEVIGQIEIDYNAELNLSGLADSR